MHQKLYGVGVGPGDPSLLTLKAADVLKRSGVVFVPRSRAGRPSVALGIARDYLSPQARIIELDLPMTEEEEALAEAWQEAARVIVAELQKAPEGAFLTLGDPSIYSTFGYVAQRVRQLEPQIKVEVIPGITSFAAAAARAGVSLAQKDQALIILPAADSPLASYALASDAAVVVLKASRDYTATVKLLETSQRLPGSVLVSRVGLKGERVDRLVAEEPLAGPDYLSLIISRPKEG